MRQPVRNYNIDLIRVVACMAVVGLHTFQKYSSEPAIYLYYLCGFAVPFFFMASGFYLLNRDPRWGQTVRKCTGVIRIVFLWNVIDYLIETLYATDSTLRLRRMAGDVLHNTLYCLRQEARLAHFWFLGALLIIYLMAPLLAKSSQTMKKYILCGLLLICVIMQGASYMTGAPVQERVSQTYRLWTWLLYFYLGGFSAEITERISTQISFPIHLTAVTILAALNLSFHRYVGKYIFYTDSQIPSVEYFYDSLLGIIWITAMFTLLLRIQISKTIGQIICQLSSLTMGIYIIHFPLRWIITEYLDIGDPRTLLAYWTITLVTSATITWILNRTMMGRFLIQI